MSCIGQSINTIPFFPVFVWACWR